MQQPKWFRQDKDLVDADVVMFQKDDSHLDGRWTLGTADQVIKSKDGIVRRVVVKYTNAGEEFPRFTDRNVRSLVKLWSIDDLSIEEDLAKVHEKLASSCYGFKQVRDSGTRACGSVGAVSRMLESGACICRGSCGIAEMVLQEGGFFSDLVSCL